MLCSVGFNVVLLLLDGVMQYNTSLSSPGRLTFTIVILCLYRCSEIGVGTGALAPTFLFEGPNMTVTPLLKNAAPSLS